MGTWKAMAPIGLILVVGIGLVWGLRTRPQVELRKEADRLEAVQARASALGFPTSLDEFRAMVAVPDDENAEREYRAIVAYLGTEGKDLYLADRARNIVDHPGHIDPEFEEDAAPVLAILERASRKPTLVFDRKWDDGFAILMPEYAALKDLQNIVLARSRLRLGRGAVEAALDDWRMAAQLARHLKEDVTLIGYLVGLALESMLLTTVVQAVGERPQIAREPALIEALNRLDHTDVRRPFFGEIAIVSVANLQNLDAWEDDPVPTMRARGWLRPRHAELLRQALLARLLEEIANAFEALPEHDVWGPDELRTLQEFKPEERPRGADAAFAEMLTPTGQVLQSQMRSQAQRRVTRLFVELRAAGIVPRTPDDLLRFGPLKVDPFTGDPLRVRYESDQDWAIYSVGPNLTDDGGARSLDLVAALVPPE